jgi:hypothetical protein
MKQGACAAAYRLYFGVWKENKQEILGKQVRARQPAFRHGVPHRLHCGKNGQQSALEICHCVHAGRRGWTQCRLTGNSRGIKVKWQRHSTGGSVFCIVYENWSAFESVWTHGCWLPAPLVS